MQPPDEGRRRDEKETAMSTNKTSDPSAGDGADRDSLKSIAEAAYYRAERRGFAPGNEVDDWLAAEADILKAQREARAPQPGDKKGR
jgi:hypothetical protein